jgi:branched-chain amino acid transport system substrate-binding protein
MVLQRSLALSTILAAVVWATTAVAEIRIATASAMTGWSAWFGEQYESGAKLAIEHLNSKGGLLGQRVELIVGDDFCDADQVVALARKLVSDGVVFVKAYRRVTTPQ